MACYKGRREFETSPKQVTFIFAWEATQVDKESAGGPALYYASLGQYKKWMIMWTTCADRHLIGHDCVKFGFKARSKGGSPVRIIALTHRLCALASQQPAKFIKFLSRFGLELGKPFRPSGYEDCFKPKALLVPWGSTLQLSWSASGFSAPCGGSLCSLQWCRGETQASRTLGPYLLGLNTLCIF